MWETNPRICEIPSEERTLELAQEVGRNILAATVSTEPEGIATALGWKFEIKPIKSEALEALLFPLLRENCLIVTINSNLEPSPTHTKWLLCHEIGHSLFWRPGTPPQRGVRWKNPSFERKEEEYADNFADKLLPILEQGRYHE